MSLWLWIRQGFGWGLGHELAKDVYAEAKDALVENDHPAPPPPADPKAAAKLAKKRIAEQRRREKELDDELAAIKKRLRREGR